jgi:putative addiction module component (TIGR02574 family)
MVNTNELLALPPAEQLRIIELLWDKFGEDPASIPLPSWIADEGQRRFDELKSNLSIALDHETVWARIEKRNG